MTPREAIDAMSGLLHKGYPPSQADVARLLAVADAAERQHAATEALALVESETTRYSATGLQEWLARHDAALGTLAQATTDLTRALAALGATS